MLNEMGEPFTTFIKCCKFVISSVGVNSTLTHSPNHLESKQSFLKYTQQQKSTKKSYKNHELSNNSNHK